MTVRVQQHARTQKTEISSAAQAPSKEAVAAQIKVLEKLKPTITAQYDRPVADLAAAAAEWGVQKKLSTVTAQVEAIQAFVDERKAQTARASEQLYAEYTSLSRDLRFTPPGVEMSKQWRALPAQLQTEIGELELLLAQANALVDELAPLAEQQFVKLIEFHASQPEDEVPSKKGIFPTQSQCLRYIGQWTSRQETSPVDTSGSSYEG